MGRVMRGLAPGYSCEVDSVDKDLWFEIMRQFGDANIYQTWSYGTIRFGEANISHLILKREGTVVAAAQARILRIPSINVGVSYVRWGPLWQLRERSKDLEVLSQALRALRNEYVCWRGLVLRLFPMLYSKDSDDFLQVLKQEGFSLVKDAVAERTLIVDLSPTIEQLRKGLQQKWRNCLNHAERNGLEIVAGDEDKLFATFIGIYRQMLARKKFVETNDVNKFRLIQKDLPDNYKMRILICRSEGVVCCGAIFGAIGKTGIYLFGATNEIGMKTNGSYLLQWKFLEWLKEKHFAFYDLNGINPETNSGTYKFKAGLCGRNGKDVSFLGQFDSSANLLGSFLVEGGNILRSIYRKAKPVIQQVLSGKGINRTQGDSGGA